MPYLSPHTFSAFSMTWMEKNPMASVKTRYVSIVVLTSIVHIRTVVSIHRTLTTITSLKQVKIRSNIWEIGSRELIHVRHIQADKRRTYIVTLWRQTTIRSNTIGKNESTNVIGCLAHVVHKVLSLAAVSRGRWWMQGLQDLPLQCRLSRGWF